MGKTALITGASGGLGQAFAKAYAAQGFDLVLVARSTDTMLALKEELKSAQDVKVWVFPCDLVRKDAALSVAEFLKANDIQLDALVNNAGFGDFGPFARCNWEKQYEMVQVNVTALMQLTRCILPDMIARKHGVVLNVASIAAFQAGPLMSVYYASKAFVLSFTEALSVELKGTGVRVLALCPGPTKTGFEARANLKNSGLFHNMKVGGATDVVAYGLRMLEKGKVIAIPGLLNRTGIVLSKFAPRSLSAQVVYLIQKAR